MENAQTNEPVTDTKNITLEIKMSAKGEKYYTYKVRADTIDELTVLSEQTRTLAEKTIKGEL